MSLNDIETYKVIDDVNSYYRLQSESKGELLLNKYPNAAAAYSLRLLDGYYRGPLVRVRRVDGVEVDVYPDYNNELSLDSLVTNVDVHTTNDGIPDADYTFELGLHSLGEFVGHDGYSSTLTSASTATVCVWYDQSKGNQFDLANNAEQVAADSQPKIYDSADGLVREGGAGNKKPIMEGVSSGGLNVSLSPTQAFTISAVSGATHGAVGVICGEGARLYQGGVSYLYAGTFLNSNISTALEQSAFFGEFNGASSKISIHTASASNVVTGDGGAGTSITCLLNRTTSRSNQTSLHEFILWDTGQDTAGNRTGIEQDINNHYQIEGYTPPQPLLNQYSGAAAAYSLRLLDSNYTGPLVRVRDVNNVEVDVYPDSNGEFSLLSPISDGGNELSSPYLGSYSAGSTDKTKLYEFVYGRSTDLTVVVWYDQANSNDATQTTTGSQPTIYTNGDIVTKNGNSFLYFDANSQFANMTSNISTSPHSAFLVAQGTLNRRQIYGFGANDAYLHIDLSFWNTSLTNSRVGDGSNYTVSASTIPSDELTHLFSAIYNSPNYNLYAEGESIASSSSTYISSEQLSIGARDGSPMYLAELVLYLSDQGTAGNRTNIESNINDYYNIYTP